jgi:hypothetical protein
MLRDGLVDADRFRALFAQVEDSLYRYPAIDAAALRRAVESFGIR